MKYAKLMQPMRKFNITLGSNGLTDPSVGRQAKYFFKHTTTPHPCWAARGHRIGDTGEGDELQQATPCLIRLLLDAAHESSGCSPKAECPVRDSLIPSTSGFSDSETEL